MGVRGPGSNLHVDPLGLGELGQDTVGSHHGFLLHADLPPACLLLGPSTCLERRVLLLPSPFGVAGEEKEKCISHLPAFSLRQQAI